MTLDRSNSNLREIDSRIGFADSSYHSCEMSNKSLIVYLNSWDDKIIKLNFIYPIHFVYMIGSFVLGLYEKSDETSFLARALSEYYEKIPTENQLYSVFALVDIDDREIFKVVAQGAFVTKEEKKQFECLSTPCAPGSAKL